MQDKTYQALFDNVMNNVSIRFKLKKALQAFHDADPFDSLEDAELLNHLMKMRCDEIREMRKMRKSHVK